jgi:hypothetical protein
MSSCNRSNGIWLALLGASCALVNCSVDDRTLDTAVKAGSSQGGSSGAANAGRGGTGSGNRAGADDPGEGGEGAEGGVASSGGGGMGGKPYVPTGGTGESGSGGTLGDGGCGDVDDDGVQDCEQTLAQNARFMSDVSAWQAEPSLKQKWDQRNARPGQTSGALSVRNENVAEGNSVMLAGSQQCVPAVGDQKYFFAAQAFLPSGQTGSSAGLAVRFFATDDCSSVVISDATLQLVNDTDKWVLVQGTTVAPNATRAMWVRLVTGKPFMQPSVEALFDDVLVRQE